MLRRSFAWSGPRHWDPWPRQPMPRCLQKDWSWLQTGACRANQEFPSTKGFSDWYLLTTSTLESTWSLEGTKPSMTLPICTYLWTIDCSCMIQSMSSWPPLPKPCEQIQYLSCGVSVRGSQPLASLSQLRLRQLLYRSQVEWRVIVLVPLSSCQANLETGNS